MTTNRTQQETVQRFHLGIEPVYAWRRPGRLATTDEESLPVREAEPVAPGVKALYVENSPRRLVRALADGGEDNLAALRRTWPQLADELEALAATLALPVREPHALSGD